MCMNTARKSVVRLTDRPDMTLDVYRGRNTATQHIIFQQNFSHIRTIMIMNVCDGTLFTIEKFLFLILQPV